MKEILEKDLGITDYTSEEIETIKQHSNSEPNLLYVLNNLVSVRSQTGWTTHGHSAVDVNIYAYTNSKQIRSRLLSSRPYYGLLGNHENIEIGAFMEAITGVNLDKITKLVSKTKHSIRAKLSSIEVDQMHRGAY